MFFNSNKGHVWRTYSVNEFGQYVPDTRDGEYLLYVVTSRIPFIMGVV